MNIRSLLTNAVAVLVILMVFGFLFETSMRTPVMELHYKKGNCLRVIAHNGAQISNGCQLAKNGQLTAEHIYVAR